MIVHYKELKRTTNTGRLALHALENSSMHVRGEIGAPLDLSSILLPEYESVVLYPCEDAVEIESLAAARPIQLIVSDGNWRQAAKINTRHPELKHLRRVKIRGAATSEFHLRKEHFADGLATMEAIAYALKALEGDDVGEALLNLYRAKLHATLEGRGQPITIDIPASDSLG